MNFDNLPAIRFADYDVSKIQERYYADYEQTATRKLYPGNPERLFIDSHCSELSRARYCIDHTGRQNLLTFATGEYLDGLAANFNVTRLPAQPARMVVRFELAEPLPTDLVLEPGVRMTPAGDLLFLTLGTLKIPSGELAASVEAVCNTPGVIGNGWVAGQVSQLIDPHAHIDQVVNETTSLGGCEAETDEQLRRRVALAPYAFRAGSANGYKYHTYSVSPIITDVTLQVVQPGLVRVVLLTQNGPPSAETIGQVFAALNADDVRPLTDTLIVSGPDPIEYTIDLEYLVTKDHAHRATLIDKDVDAAMEQFVKWQAAKLGRAITPSELTRRVQSIQGVAACTMHSPDYQALQPFELASHVQKQEAPA